MDGKIHWKSSQSNTFELSEIQQAWALISETPNISIVKLAKQLGTSKTRAQALSNLLCTSGCVSRGQKGQAGYMLKIPYVTEKLAREGRYVRTNL